MIEPRGASFGDHDLDDDEPDGGEPPGGDGLSDKVIRLREWGTSRIFPLPSGRAWHNSRTKVIALELSDRHVASRAVVSSAVEMTYERRSWRIMDRKGVGDLKHDGRPSREISLTAGTEVTVAKKTLIAESPRSIALRGLCCRLLGWSDERMSAVDLALRAIRLATSGRSPLFLRGEGYLAPIAYALHRHTLGEAAPFVVSDRRREDSSATVRGPANFKIGMVAFRNASGGSLCVGMPKNLPSDFEEVLRAFREPDSGVRLVVCSMASAREGLGRAPVPLDIPPLRSRRSELLRIVGEFADDAIASLGARDGCFDARDAAWVMQHSAATIPEIEKATLRVVAVKISRSLTQAASILGKSQISLARWLGRRPAHIENARTRVGRKTGR